MMGYSACEGHKNWMYFLSALIRLKVLLYSSTRLPVDSLTAAAQEIRASPWPNRGRLA